MTSPLSSDFCKESYNGDTLTRAIQKIRDRLRAVASSQLIRPEKFGAVANSLSAASANREALQAWFDSAANGGVLFQDPNDVYYVQARPVDGQNAVPPLQLKYPSNIPILRLKPRAATAGNDYRLLELTYVAGASYALANEGILRDQYTWTVTDLPPSLAFNAEVLLSAGEDAYDSSTNALYLRARIKSYDPATGMVRLDQPAPRAFGRCVASPMPKLTLIRNSASGTEIGILDMDQSEPGGAAIDRPLALIGVTEVVMGAYLHKAPTDGGIAFTRGSDRNLVLYLESDCGSSQSLQGSGLVYGEHSRDNKILHARMAHPQSTRYVINGRYSGPLRIGRMECLSGGAQWEQFDLSILRTEKEAEAISIDSVKVDAASDAGGGATPPGIVLASSAQGGDECLIGSVHCNKDLLRFGCRPGYVETKTLCGRRVHLVRNIDLPANPSSASVATTDFWLGSFFMDEFRFKYSGSFDQNRSMTGFDLSLWTGTYDAAGVQTDSLLSPYGAPGSVFTPQLAGQWTEWQLPDRDKSGISDGNYYNFCGNSVDRMLRYVAPITFPAGTLTIAFSGYPVRNLFVRDDT